MTKEGAKKVYIYPVDTVLVCCTASVGECAMTKVPMGSNQQFNGLTIKNQEVLLPDFLLFVASTLKDKLLQFAGKTTINFVSRSSLERILIPVPNIEEQKTFVSFVHQADKSKQISEIEAMFLLVHNFVVHKFVYFVFFLFSFAPK